MPYSGVFKPYSDVLMPYSGVFLQIFYKCDCPIFRVPYSDVLKPYSGVFLQIFFYKRGSGALELDFPKIEFHASFFIYFLFIVLLGITRFSTNRVFH